jgi:hypothetical protein
MNPTKIFLILTLLNTYNLFSQNVDINIDHNSGELTEITFIGEVGVDLFGVTVSSAGDVNGDGYEDIIIGAPFNDAGGVNAGRAYIFFGGTAMDSIADVVLTGEAAGDIFGISVSSAGDVNGDSYDDVIVGAQENSAGGTAAGRVYIYFGGELMDDTADIIMTGTTPNNFFGKCVAGAGDVNGDGYDDVLASAPYNNNSTGITYIFYGGLLMDTIPDVVMIGENLVQYFGSSIASAGDVNGDSFADVLIGGAYNSSSTSAGKAYLYLGGVSMDSTADVVMNGEMISDRFGYSVSSAGDVNGDGFSDVIIGSINNDAGGMDAGRAYIYFGATNMDNTADWISTGEASEDQFGSSVASVGDINEDGFSDVIVGATFNDAGGSNAGRAYVYFGAANMDSTADWIFTGEADGDFFGLSVSTPGDANGDGISDILIGAPYNDFGGVNAGKAYLYLSSPTIPVELTSFSATYNDKTEIALYWGTATEVNNQGFSVERSINYNEWQNIVFIEGNGNSTTPNQYSYIDKDLSSGVTKFLYRLKQIDYDGSFEYSDIVEVEVTPKQYELSQNYPNPFNPSTSIEFSVPEESFVELKVFDILGNEVVTLASDNYSVGTYKILFKADDLPSGIYIARLSAGNFIQTKKMLLLK